MKPKLGSLFAGLLAMVAAVVLSAVPEGSALAAEKRLVFVSAGFDESNRVWDVSKPDHVQYDPFLETLLEVDPASGEYGPRLATEWDHSEDFKTWTFTLRRGVQFHFGHGEFTSKDVAHSHSLYVRDDSIATLSDLWRQVESVETPDEYTVVFNFKNPVTRRTAEYAFARSGDMKIVSKAQWDNEGVEGYAAKPAGTGSYEFVERNPGLNLVYKAVEDHWSGNTPAFEELEIRIAKEPATRLAMLLAGEAHVGDLPRELHADAAGRGLKRLSSTMAVDWVSVYFGGLYLEDDEAFRPEVPWTKKKVRQALNMAVNRQELLDAVFAGRGTMNYISNWTAASEGWDPAWKDLYEELYPYDPERAKELLKEAGYEPGDIKVELWGYTSPGESEHPAIADAMGIYFNAIGVDANVELLDWAKVRASYRGKDIHCCMWPNVISWRPAIQGVRNWWYSGSASNVYNSKFVDEVYLEWNDTLDTDRREELARSMGKHLIENFAEIPLFWFRNEVFANGDVVDSWTYPGLGAGRTTQFDLIKPAS